ncbi:MAG: ABC transporter ATP-binding protein [Nitriliruptorales bacterium]
MNERMSVVETLRRAAGIAPALAAGLGLTLFLAILGTAGQVVVPIAIQQVLDREVFSGGEVDVAAVALLCGAAATGLLVAIAATRAAMYRLVRAAANGLAELRVVAFRHLHRLSMLDLQSERRGALVARVTSDVETVNEFLEWGGVGMVVGGAQISIALAVMLVYDWRLAVLVLAAAVVYGAMLLLFQRIIARQYDKVRLRVADSLAAIGEAVAGLPTIRAYGAEARTRARVDHALDEQFRAEFRAGALGAVMFSSAELFAASLTAGVIAAGVLLAGGITPGMLVAFLFLVTLFIEPVQMVVEILDHAQTSAAGLRRILGLIDMPIEVADPEDGVDLPEGPIDVAFEGVSLRYPGDERAALLGVDAHIDAGRRVAIVGETGSGKTTFAKLMTRLLDPTDGQVRLAGVPADRVRFASLRSRVAFVPQEGFLFDGTVGDNVRYGRPEASDAEVRRAFEELGLVAWLDDLPSGLATRVGERGGRLSAGEQQLVAVVRAWIAAPDLLVLDEATSAVDPALEVRLRRAIQRLTAGRTSVTIAHRLSTAEAADEVLVFDQGRLVQRGQHDDLLAGGGVYAALHADWSLGTAI